MNYRTSRVYSAPIPKMPPGLLELMEGLSKDVLRNNPINIYEFCADHMQKLLQIRDDKPSQNVSLEQKITKAQNIVRERAKQRRENNDKIIAEQKDNLHNMRLLNQDLEKAPNVILQNNIKIPEREIIDNQVGVYDSDDVKEQNNENCTISNSEVNDFEHTSLNINEPVERHLNERQILVNKENEVEGNEQNTNVECIELIEIQNNNQIVINTNEETDIYIDSKNEKFDSKEDLALHVEQNVEFNTSNESSVHKKVSEENFDGGIAEIDRKISLENENLDTDDNAVKSTESVDVPDKNIQLKPKQDNDSPVLNVNDSLNDELGLIITNIDQSHQSNTESTEQIQEKYNNISVDDSDMPRKKNDCNNLLTDETHQNGMDLETAAITIQKVFRSFLFKSKTTSIDDATNVDINLFINDKDVQDDINISNVTNKERRGISRMDTVLQTVNEEKSLSLSTDDSSTLSSAATIIQAHIRGFLVRNKLNVNKASTSSLLDSDCLSGASIETDSDQQKGKTILNIHIVPERGHFTSRDESILTSMDLSLDSSPPSSANLHPHSYDINERRKQLKREDAVQSVSPPSNNSSSKLSEDVDSVRELVIPDNTNDLSKHITTEMIIKSCNDEYSTNNDIQTAVEKEVNEKSPQRSFENHMASDELDVVTPYIEQGNGMDSDKVKLLHSSEFHEVVLPTKVSRTDTSVVREFHNVLAFFLLWN